MIGFTASFLKIADMWALCAAWLIQPPTGVDGLDPESCDNSHFGYWNVYDASPEEPFNVTCDSGVMFFSSEDEFVFPDDKGYRYFSEDAIVQPDNSIRVTPGTSAIASVYVVATNAAPGPVAVAVPQPTDPPVPPPTDPPVLPPTDPPAPAPVAVPQPTDPPVFPPSDPQVPQPTELPRPPFTNPTGSAPIASPVTPPTVQPVSDQADAESTTPKEPDEGKNLKPLYVLIIPFVGVAGYFMYKHRIHHNKLEAGGESSLPAASVTLHSDIDQPRQDPSSASIPAEEEE